MDRPLVRHTTGFQSQPSRSSLNLDLHVMKGNGGEMNVKAGKPPYELQLYEVAQWAISTFVAWPAPSETYPLIETRTARIWIQISNPSSARCKSCRELSLALTASMQIHFASAPPLPHTWPAISGSTQGRKPAEPRQNKASQAILASVKRVSNLTASSQHPRCLWCKWMSPFGIM